MALVKSFWKHVFMAQIVMLLQGFHQTIYEGALITFNSPEKRSAGQAAALLLATSATFFG